MLFTERHALFVPLAGGPDWGRFGRCPMLQQLLLLRGDIARNYDLDTESGLADAIAWMYVRALPEYGIDDLVDATTLQALNAPVDYYPAPSGQGLATSDTTPTVQLSVLMALVWRHRPDIQALFDIAHPAGRRNFCYWFVAHGVTEMKLQRLVSGGWRNWLLGNASAQAGPALPRVGLLAWLARADLQTAFDPKTAAGLAGLIDWTRNSLRDDPGWQWLLTAPDAVAAAKERRDRWQARPDAAFGVNLIGFARGELGIGEDVRMAAAACEAAGILYSLVNISTGGNTRQADTTLAANLAAPSRAPYPINIFCLTGFDTVRVYFEQGAELFEHRYNIGWWPWELPVWPEQWRPALQLVDEVWAATDFTRTMYAAAAARDVTSAALPMPVRLMPLPASVATVKPMSREALGLAPKRFLFLYVFDFNSYLARKNPFAALQAFRRAFAEDDRSVGLVLKTMNGNPKDRMWKRFARECGRDTRVTLLKETLDRGEVLGLIQACDAYVSLHRSEGFGRTLAEAMLLGLPVVGTNFSGNVDFLNAATGFPVAWTRRPVAPGEYPFVTDSDAAWWAEPDVDDAARQMRAARKAAGDWHFMESVRRFAQKQFSPARVGELMRERTQAVYRELDLNLKETQ